MRRTTELKGVLTHEIYDSKTGRFETATVPFTDFSLIGCAIEAPPSEALSPDFPERELVMALKLRRIAARRLLSAADHAARITAPTPGHWRPGTKNSESSPILVTR